MQPEKQNVRPEGIIFIKILMYFLAFSNQVSRQSAVERFHKSIPRKCHGTSILSLANWNESVYKMPFSSIFIQDMELRQKHGIS